MAEHDREQIAETISDKPVSTLILTVDDPWPPISGGDLRNWRTTLAAAKLGPVTTVSLWGSNERKAPPDGIDVRAFSELSRGEVYTRPKGGAAIDVTLPDDWQQRIGRVLAEVTPDVVVLENLSLWPFLDLPELSKARIIVDMHNVESRLFAAGEPLWRRITKLDRKVRGVRRIEERVITAADEVWVCSKLDGDRLRQIHRFDAPVRVVPNGIPSTLNARTNVVPADSRVRSGPPSLLFIGHLSYPPNIQASEFIAQEIMPELRKRLPGAEVVLAGREPHRRVWALETEGVKIMADPASLDPIYASSDIAVIPLRRGGGTRIKAIEAMACGLPVVATSLAVEGLNLEPGRHYRHAESAGQFVAEIERLWREPSLADQQRLVAHNFALDRFGEAEINKRIAAGLTGSGDAGMSA